LISWIIGTVAMVQAAKWMSIEIRFAEAAVIWGVTSACELIPYVGLPLAIFALFAGLKHVTREEIWPVLAQLVALSVAATVGIAIATGWVIGSVVGALS
jgi:hypothetical protein